MVSGPVSLMKTDACLGASEGSPGHRGLWLARPHPRPQEEVLCPVVVGMELALGLGWYLPAFPRMGAPPHGASIFTNSPPCWGPPCRRLTGCICSTSHYHCLTLLWPSALPHPSVDAVCWVRVEPVGHFFWAAPPPHTPWSKGHGSPPPGKCPCKAHVVQTVITVAPALPQVRTAEGPSHPLPSLSSGPYGFICTKHPRREMFPA